MRAVVEIETISTVEGLNEIRPEWEVLWKSAPFSTPFHSPHWLIAWWEHFGNGNLLTTAMRFEGRLVGLIPLYILQPKPGALREVRFVGTGISDYLGGLLEAGYEESVTTQTLEFLADHQEQWDLCLFEELQPNSPFTVSQTPSGWTSQVFVQETCPFLKLPVSLELMEDVIPGRQLENFRYYFRRASNLGTLKLQQADSESFRTAFDALLKLHAARFNSLGRPGVLSDPAVRAFHQKAARQLLEIGVLRLYTLSLDSQVVAAFYGLVQNRKIYYYLGGFDPEFASLSLGSLLIGLVIQESIGEGFEECDFLRGGESYKYHWGCKDRPNYARRLFSCQDISFQLEKGLP